MMHLGDPHTRQVTIRRHPQLHLSPRGVRDMRQLRIVLPDAGIFWPCRRGLSWSHTHCSPGGEGVCPCWNCSSSHSSSSRVSRSHDIGVPSFSSPLISSNPSVSDWPGGSYMRLLTNSLTSGAGTTLVVCCSCHWMKPGEVYQSSVPPCGHSVWMYLQSTMLR